MVQCNRCNLQYIGETKRRIKDRFNEHRRAVDKTKPTTVSEHFLSHSIHSHTDTRKFVLDVDVTLPSPCTAFSQSLSVNSSRSRIRGERAGNA